MCGIFGIYRASGITTKDLDQAQVLNRWLTHRGPDSQGSLVNEALVVGMTRLRINDLLRGDQPLFSERAEIAVVGNGEIYNADELRIEAEARGHKFQSRSDMEVVVHLFEEYESDVFVRLRGMFSLCIVDRAKQRLFLARDPLGEKPLFYTLKDGFLAFSSELRPLILSDIAEPRVRSDVLYEYFMTGYVEEPKTIIAGVNKLGPGCYLSLDLETGQVSFETYWSFAEIQERRQVDADELEALVLRSVRNTLKADTGIALALSGGIDSSLLAGMISREGGEVTAISVGYEVDVEHGVDESRMAEALARELEIPYVRELLSTSEVTNRFPSVCWQKDEPIADISGSGYAALACQAHLQGCSVLITGQGADEIFWGYPWVRQAAIFSTLARAVPQGQWGTLVKGLEVLVKPAMRQQTSRHPRLPRGLRSALRSFRTASTLLNRNAERLPLMNFHPSFREVNAITEHLLLAPINELNSLEIDAVNPSFAISSGIMRSYLLNNGLAQSDRLSMAYSVENRTPFVSQEIVEAVMGARRIESDSFGHPKDVLSRVAARYLPEEVVNRPKRGFSPPISRWTLALQRRYFSELHSPILVRQGLMHPDTSRYLSGEIQCDWLFWIRLVTLEFWLQMLEENATSAVCVA